MKYFAYGSNMSIKRMIARVPSTTVDTVACLKKHALLFHKKSKDGSAKCDVIETEKENDTVWGVVFDIDEDEKTKLDGFEGRGYKSKEIELIGRDEKTFKAITYYAANIDEHLKPYSWYTEHVLRGAREHNLPPEYIASIEKVKAIQDPDQERHDRELAIYR